jgi:hypothetical protein
LQSGQSLGTLIPFQQGSWLARGLDWQSWLAQLAVLNGRASLGVGSNFTLGRHGISYVKKL